MDERANSKRVGRHLVRLVAPGVVYIRYDGDLSGPEAKSISVQMTEWTQDRDCTYLTDITSLGALGPEARRELGAGRAEAVTDRPVTIKIVFIGATMRTKVLMSVILTAARLLSNYKLEQHYFSHTSDAASWAGLDEALLVP